MKRQKTLDKGHSNRAVFDTKDKTLIKQETSLLIGDHDGMRSNVVIYLILNALSFTTEPLYDF